MRGTLGALRTDGAILVLGVPVLGHRDLLDVRSGVGGVDDVAAADVHGHVAFAVVQDQVTRLQGRHGDVGQGVPVLVGGARDRHPSGRPGGLGQAGAVVAGVTRAGAPVDVGATELGQGEVGRLATVGRAGHGGRGGGAGAAGAHRVGVYGRLVLRGQVGVHGLLVGERLAGLVLLAQ